MKNYRIYRILALTFIVLVFLPWVISVGMYLIRGDEIRAIIPAWAPYAMVVISGVLLFLGAKCNIWAEKTLKQKFMERLVKKGRIGDSRGYFQLVPEEFLSQVDGTISYHSGHSAYFFKDVDDIFSIPEWREELKRLMKERK